MKSVFFKNFLMTAGTCVLCMTVLFASLFFAGRGYVLREKRESLTTAAEEVQRTVSAQRREREWGDFNLRMSLSSVAASTGNHIFLCDKNGKVVSCSDRDMLCEHIGKIIDEDICVTIATEGEYTEKGTLGGFYAEDYYLVGVPLCAPDNRVIGFAFVGSSAAEYTAEWSRIAETFALLTGAVLCGMVVLAWFISRRQSAPLREMARAAHRFARGEFSVRVTGYTGRDEIGELTESFNHMAEELQRNEAQREDFIANVSHELRTPMTAIAGFADGLLDGTIPAENSRPYLEKISGETKRLARLVRDMLTASRLRGENAASRLTKTEFDISELVVRALLSFEKRVEQKRVEINPDLPEEPVRVRADEDAITRVLYNLIDNALKFCAEGSELTLSVWRENGLVYTAVRNVGETIPPEELPLIFDRFHKTDRSRGVNKEGAGLGLYIVRAILDAHDRNIYVSSENGVTAFTFTLDPA